MLVSVLFHYTQKRIGLLLILTIRKPKMSVSITLGMGFDSELVTLIEKHHILVDMFCIINYISSSLYHSLASDTPHRFLQVSFGPARCSLCVVDIAPSVAGAVSRALTLGGGLY